MACACSVTASTIRLTISSLTEAESTPGGERTAFGSRGCGGEGPLPRGMEGADLPLGIAARAPGGFGRWTRAGSSGSDWLTARPRWLGSFCWLRPRAMAGGAASGWWPSAPGGTGCGFGMTKEWLRRSVADTERLHLVSSAVLASLGSLAVTDERHGGYVRYKT